MQAGQLAAAATEVGGRFRNGRHASIKVKVEKVPPHLVLGGLVAQNKNCHYCHYTATKKGESRGKLPRVIKQDVLARPKHGASVTSTARKVSVLLKDAPPTRYHEVSVSSTARGASARLKAAPPTL